MIINGKVIGVHIEDIENFREVVSVKTVKFVMEKWLGLPHVSLEIALFKCKSWFLFNLFCFHIFQDGKYTIDEMLEEIVAKIIARGKQKGV